MGIVCLDSRPRVDICLTLKVSLHITQYPSHFTLNTQARQGPIKPTKRVWVLIDLLTLQPRNLHLFPQHTDFSLVCLKVEREDNIKESILEGEIRITKNAT